MMNNGKLDKKKLLIFVILIAVVLVIILVVAKGFKKDEEEPNEGETTIQTDGDTKIVEGDKLAETREYEGLEISNIRFEIKNNLNYLKADIKNSTSQTSSDQYVDFHIYNKEGKKIGCITSHIPAMEPGEEKPLSSTLATNGKELESYDVVITKKDEPSPRDEQNKEANVTNTNS